jgi:signal transduction histidine kinase
VDELVEAWTQVIAKVEEVDPIALATKRHDEHKHALTQTIRSWRNDIHKRLDGERSRVAEWEKVDAARFDEQTSKLLVDLAQQRVQLATVLSRFEVERETLRQEFTQRYQSYLRALDRLIEGVDVEGALRWSSDEIDTLKEKVAQVHSLAQLGVTVEIIGHELDDLDDDVRRGLNKLPRPVQQTDAFRLAKNAHLALAHKLRFLTPLKLSGSRNREQIKGKEIGKYLREFFAEKLKNARTELVVSESYEQMIVTDFRSRLYPVFINLVNNALYWTTFAEGERRILLDCVGDAVVVADSGRGIDPDDLPRLFELFFTRRVDGRGVGLYLCKENLGAGGHTIEYAEVSEHRLLSGANFVIHFRGIEHG